MTTVPTQVLLTAGVDLLREGLDGMLDRSGFSSKPDLLLQLAGSSRSRYCSVETDAGCDDVEADRGEAEDAWLWRTRENKRARL